MEKTGISVKMLVIVNQQIEICKGDILWEQFVTK